MGKLINIGYGNMVNSDKIVTVISPDSAPVKRLIQAAKENGSSVDATQGRKTRAIIITDSSHVVLSALLPETIAERVESADKSLVQNKERTEEHEK
ncbi:MAG: DUF370 domain-containing protein [Lachnospiraceae bacterium]|nr:DUF370 domain-containing protein [Lachnospiraceae bacterium]